MMKKRKVKDLIKLKMSRNFKDSIIDTKKMLQSQINLLSQGNLRKDRHRKI